MTPKILAFAGATRSGSWNKKLVAVATASARAAGAEVTLVDLRDFPMPLYDGDIEVAGGLPEQARSLKAMMVAHDGLLVSCPEYNGSITPLLKNTLDWLSRQQPGEPPTSAFRGKAAGLLAASPGNLGGIRGLLTVRQVLTALGTLVVPTQFGLARAADAFDTDGQLQDPAHRKAVDAVTQELVGLLGRLKG